VRPALIAALMAVALIGRWLYRRFALRGDASAPVAG
jgi:hypothetical protein